MATAVKKTPDTAEAFVLLDCLFGRAGEVVILPKADADIGAASGMLDLHPDAIAAAKHAKD